ncbi:hypothetical protein F5B22DRAFT_640987 [Xylaria bambusicola]|uniref:uncharacterized protein n=1 Tax=Xylaria bambusicola TaxID=326684 RepID=UPI0020077B3C|nr:uncharacterized protein F5B22DRAFT_640987 [Xylaria bambusicola]KAI0528011.1 hypothetical protein F5B22DRAFT_640987 [Xylaria bambusicola]
MAVTRSANKSVSSAVASGAYAHAPSAFTLLWLAISLPLVAWDCGYVLMRPRTMEGGDLHWPIYLPYKLYGEIDYIYGWPAVHAGNGFTAGQGLLNVIETLMYMYYWVIYYQNAVSIGGTKKVVGRKAAIAVLVAFSAAVMTLSKTVLYWLCEYYSGYANIGHNSMQDLVFLWIIPNGAWLVAPTVMIYELGGELVDHLAAGAGPKRD